MTLDEFRALKAGEHVVNAVTGMHGRIEEVTTCITHIHWTDGTFAPVYTGYGPVSAEEAYVSDLCKMVQL